MNYDYSGMKPLGMNPGIPSYSDLAKQIREALYIKEIGSISIPMMHIKHNSIANFLAEDLGAEWAFNTIDDTYTFKRRV